MASSFKQSIHIESFGPIKNVTIPMNDIVILNGKQSSGKSTISKAIYLFKALPEKLLKSLVADESFAADFDKNLVVSVRNEILSIFGTTKHFDGFKLEFKYTQDKTIKIHKDYHSGHARVVFSDSLKKELKNIAKKIESFWKETKNQKSNEDFYAFYASRLQFFNAIKHEIQSLFQENHESFFIPAGRSLVSTLSGELKNIDSYNFDSLMKDFVQKVFNLRETFSKNLDEIIEDKKKLSSAPIDFESIKKAKNLLAEIIQGQYRYEGGEEKLLIKDDKYVKMKFSSSGQQESLWILNLLFINMLDNKLTFTIFEEPEAHLYPVTQYSVAKFIALSLNAKKNQAIITTHSPYIMASINTLLVAGKNGKKHKEEVEKLIDKSYWLDVDRLSAYFVSDGRIIDMVDKELGIIDPKYIDQASEIINDDFDRLLEISI